MIASVDEIIRESRALEAAQRYNEAMRLVSLKRREFKGDRALILRHAELFEVIKEPKQALGLYRQLFDERPELQEPELLLGMIRCLLKVDQIDHAEGLIRQVLAKMGPGADLLTSEACVLRRRKRLDEARNKATEALKLEPDYKRGRHELAEILVALGEDDQAITELERNFMREDLYGDSIDLWLAILKRQQRDRYTQEKLAQAMTQFPGKVEFVFAHGVLAHRAGEISIARPSLQEADRLSPNNSRILTELGVLERIAGHTELAQSYLGRALAIHPEQPGTLRTFGQEHKYSYGDQEFKRLNYAAAKLSESSDMEQIQLHYALAKAFEDVGELDTAFRHYGLGGGKKRKMEPYDDRGAIKMHAAMIQAVNAAAFADRPEAGCQSELPVFILGMPRSGTSLLEQILSSHPDIFGAGELKFLGGVLDNIRFGSRRIMLNNPEPVFPESANASWAERGQRFADKLASLADRPVKRVVDKMPGNFSMVGLIHAVLPKARIIHSRRHPMETCLSNYRIHFAEGQLWSYNLRDMGRHYRRYWNIMAHWRSEFPGAMYEVRYEDNVADVEGQARRLIDYLGLPWNDACLDFHNTDRPVRTASASQVRKPIYTTSTNRWRKYEKYLMPLYDEIADIVEIYEREVAESEAARAAESALD